MHKLRPPNVEVLQQYMALGTAPLPPLLKHGVFCPEDKDVQAMANAYIGDRGGYANTGGFATAEGA